LEESVLKSIPLFSGLDRINLAKLVPELEEKYFEEGKIIFHKDDEGDSLYIIIKGTARVFIQNDSGGEQDLALLGPCQSVGEMALLTGEPRSASVQARSDLITYKLSREKFQKLLNQHHFLATHLADLLSRRLKYTNEGLGGKGQVQTAATQVYPAQRKSTSGSKHIINDSPILSYIPSLATNFSNTRHNNA